MNGKTFLLSLAFAISTTVSVSAINVADDTNKTDSKGLKQGIWVENLGPTKWQGYYVDGKKTGVWVPGSPPGSPW